LAELKNGGFKLHNEDRPGILPELASILQAPSILAPEAAQ